MIMTEKNEIIARHLKNFAALTDKDIEEGKALWKPRKIKKGDFFNMQSMVCNDLGLVIKGIFRIYYRDPKTEGDKNIFFFLRISLSFLSGVSSLKILAGISLKLWKMLKLYLSRIKTCTVCMKGTAIGWNSADCWLNCFSPMHKRAQKNLCFSRMKNATLGCSKSIRIL